MKLRTLLFAAALGIAIPLAACQTLSQVATSFSTSTPRQVNTLAEALQAATLATLAVDAYVNTASPNRATLVELQTLNNGLHTALVNLQAANANGQSLALAAFNEALAAFRSYAANRGIKS